MSAASDPSVEMSVAACESELPVTQLISQLHAGRLTSRQLSIDQRQRCIGYLTQEGFGTSEIGQLLGISERTIQRDRAAINAQNAIAPDAALGDQVIGEFVQHTRQSIQRLIRMVKDDRTPPNTRVWAESVIVQNCQRFIETLHRLHYFADGKARLQHLIDTDPAERQRRADRLSANLKSAEMLLGLR